MRSRACAGNSLGGASPGRTSARSDFAIASVGGATFTRLAHRIPRPPLVTFCGSQRLVGRRRECSHAAPQCAGVTPLSVSLPLSAAVYRTSPSIAWSKGGRAFRLSGSFSSMTRRVRLETSDMTHAAPLPLLVFCAYHMPPFAGASGRMIRLISLSGGDFRSA